MEIRSILDGKTPKGKMKKIAGYIKHFGKVNMYRMGNIPKHAPSRTHGQLLVKNYGLEESRLEQFNLDDHTLDQPISVLLGIDLGLDLKLVNPY